MQKYCYDCNKETEFISVTRKEELNVHGEMITGNITYQHCTACGMEYITGESNPGFEAIYNEYRRHKGLPGPEEIRSLREKCRMNQEEFAAKTGINLDNLRRYETGAVIWEDDATRLKRFQEEKEEDTSFLVGGLPWGE